MSQDLQIVKQLVFVKYGKYLRQYPFSFVDLFDRISGTHIGSGMMPDGDSVYVEPNKLVDETHAYVNKNMMIDPVNIRRCPCADKDGWVTGIRGYFG